MLSTGAIHFYWSPDHENVAAHGATSTDRCDEFGKSFVPCGASSNANKFKRQYQQLLLFTKHFTEQAEVAQSANEH